MPLTSSKPSLRQALLRFRLIFYEKYALVICNKVGNATYIPAVALYVVNDVRILHYVYFHHIEMTFHYSTKCRRVPEKNIQI
jgi:hypothetical protein